ncbi:hypothetical protein PSTG_13457 [Puccinia striiformis f. sp. tritici PST-78]|uniref:Uncharacterized protein n=1 Tax=Puccinia striiformis f. sp. tritici PST-78 TaxID=1165861 RepID=A0A0L0V2D4_9BASI|nr:hypothetical protein PSTG_13457 [Puccinia striiformis f. sp. tritici PST-78]
MSMPSSSQANQCADSHKASDDKRNKLTWKGCDDTGLMGACCRHNAVILMGNICKLGKQRCFLVTMLDKLLTQCKKGQQVGILYNIGCLLDKYMVDRGILEKHRPAIAHCLKYYNWKGKRDLAKWLENKSTAANKRHN